MCRVFCGQKTLYSCIIDGAKTLKTNMNKQLLKEIFSTNMLLILIGAALAFLLVWQASSAALENYALQKEVDDLRSEVELLELENQSIGYNIEYYKTDAYLDLAARENFNLKSPGEKVLYVPVLNENSNSETDSEEPTSQQEPESSNFQQWLDFLFGRQAS